MTPRRLEREGTLHHLGERAVGEAHARERTVASDHRGAVGQRPAVLDRRRERALAEDTSTCILHGFFARPVRGDRRGGTRRRRRSRRDRERHRHDHPARTRVSAGVVRSRGGRRREQLASRLAWRAREPRDGAIGAHLEPDLAPSVLDAADRERVSADEHLPWLHRKLERAPCRAGVVGGDDAAQIGHGGRAPAVGRGEPGDERACGPRAEVEHAPGPAVDREVRVLRANVDAVEAGHDPLDALVRGEDRARGLEPVIRAPHRRAEHEEEAATETLRERGRELRRLRETLVGDRDRAVPRRDDPEPRRDRPQATAWLGSVALRIVDRLREEARVLHGRVRARAHAHAPERALRRTRGRSRPARHGHRGDGSRDHRRNREDP